LGLYLQIHEENINFGKVMVFLNPVGMLRNHTKYADLANFLPEDIAHLHPSVTTPWDTRAHRHS